MTPEKHGYENVAQARFINSIVYFSLLVCIYLFSLYIVRNAPLRDFIVLVIVIICILFIILVQWRTKSTVISGFSLSALVSMIILRGFLWQTMFGASTYLIFSFPVIAFYMNGKRRGSWWVFSVFLITLLFWISSLLGIFVPPVQPVELAQMLLVYIGISTATFYYETIRLQNLETMKKQLVTDQLTRLPNRTALVCDIRNSKVSHLILINIDGFKELNDFYGHPGGDEILKQVAQSLEERAHSGRVYRLYADEFAILIDKQMKPDELNYIIENIRLHFKRDSFKLEAEEIKINVTMGISEGNAKLLEMADIALGMAKKEHIGYKYAMDWEKIYSEYGENLAILKTLRNAIDNDRIVPYFQPIYDNRTRKIEKFETLVRVIDDEGKVIPPLLFLDIAKKTKLYPYITKTMIKKSFEKFYHTPWQFSINLSVDDINDYDTSEYIQLSLKESGMANQVVFEITESEGIENFDTVSEFISQVKELGCKIAIDDFGTGYSNFSYLISLNVDFLKIDASLIRNLPSDKNLQIIVETIVSFSHRLGISTIAEFVHSSEVQDKVVSMGIHHSQGYFIGKPDKEIVTEASFSR
ncbi:MAG: bifunctional diguanylate cyclase/phosphodiesterase [Brevinematales bacterium]|nr:bifunctional diguanylate cyclase/phosphodiesterase [Brevinematales bacterium]